MEAFETSDVGKGRREPKPGAAREALFQDLYCEHFNLVTRSLRRLGVPEAAVEDARQEVYLVVLRRFDAYRPGTRPKAWLRAIAHRVASTHRRSLRRRRDSTQVNVDRFCSSDAGPFRRVMDDRAREILLAFLDSLPDSQRGVFVRAQLYQMTAPEVAAALDMNLNTVYSHLRVARGKFERMVLARTRDDDIE